MKASMKHSQPGPKSKGGPKDPSERKQKSSAESRSKETALSPNNHKAMMARMKKA